MEISIQCKWELYKELGSQQMFNGGNAIIIQWWINNMSIISNIYGSLFPFEDILASSCANYLGCLLYNKDN